MKESVSIAKAANGKEESSATRSNKSALRVRTEPERQLGSLRSVIDTITRNGSTPSADSIATEVSSMPTAQRASALLGLQRTQGNRYVQQVVAGIQAKLMINPAGDKYEQEADRVAKQVVGQINQPVSPLQNQAVQRQELEEVKLLQGKTIQRQEPEEEEELMQGKLIRRQVPEEEEELQMQPDGGTSKTVTSNIESRIDSARGGGQPLSDEVREPMEHVFGTDFSRVRTHTDTEADRLNRELSAKAFTTGQDVFFREGEYSPGSDSGRKLIAHELTHVVQQQAALVFQRQEEEEQLQMRQWQALEPWRDKYVIQKAIDHELVEEYEELHQIEGNVKVVEVPNDRAITLATTFGTYPADNIYGLEGGDTNKSIFSTNWTPEQQTNIRRDDPSFLNEKAYDIMDMLGGGGYNHIHDMIILREGFQPRDLKHEMGHMKQAEKGFTGGNTQIIILEYHNILKHENVALEEGEEIRTFYNESNTRPVSDRTWEELKEAVGEDGPTANALRQIEAMLNMPRYRGKKAEIKQNLISEYYNAIR